MDGQIDAKIVLIYIYTEHVFIHVEDESEKVYRSTFFSELL